MTSDVTAQLRADLLTANYTVPALTSLWGEQAEAALHRGHRVPALRALRAHAQIGRTSTLGTMASLFLLGQSVERDEVAAAFPALGLAGALELNLLSDDPEAATPAMRAAVDLRPYEFADDSGTVTWWIASDLGELVLGHKLGENHVLGVGGASLTLSGLMMHTPVNTVLDLGTGCGIQALHASRHAQRVVATDISARALDFARLNARLNNITNIEFRLGSLFEPVAGELFDHIVSNPPFVITPRVEGVPAYEYRDGGQVGDSLVADVIRGVAQHLTPGGVAQLLGNWEYRADNAGLDRVGGWIDSALSVGPDGGSVPLDAWVIEREVQDPALYAETWIRDGGTISGVEFDQLSNAWLDDFEQRDVTSVGFGYVLLRRPAPATSPLRRIESLGSGNSAGLGDHLADTLSAHDWQAALDDGALARAFLTVAADVTEERHYWPGDEDPAAITLRQGGAFARVYPMGTVLAAVVGACDGELSIAAISAALAEILDLATEDILQEVLGSVRELVVTGFLLP